MKRRPLETFWEWRERQARRAERVRKARNLLLIAWSAATVALWISLWVQP
jgi:hypothetical protein